MAFNYWIDVPRATVNQMHISSKNQTALQHCNWDAFMGYSWIVQLWFAILGLSVMGTFIIKCCPYELVTTEATPLQNLLSSVWVVRFTICMFTVVIMSYVPNHSAVHMQFVVNLHHTVKLYISTQKSLCERDHMLKWIGMKRLALKHSR